MNNKLQHIDILKKLSLALIVGGSLAAQAQTSGSMPPPLPLPPSVSSAPSIPMAPGVAAQPAFQTKPQQAAITPVAVTAPPMPGGSDKIVAPAATAPALPTAAATAPAIPPSPSAPQAETAANAPPPLPTIEAPPVMEDVATNTGEEISPGVPMPPSFTERINASPTGIAFPPKSETAPTLHDIIKNGARTWSTKLAPTVKPYNIKFNYKREMLPPPIYAKEYDPENQHLPMAVTSEDYAHYLLEAVANNDINGTRALLDEGIDPNIMNAEGNTALTVALNHGAVDTARLLMARGASPYLAGQSGRNAYDAAAQTGQLWLMPQPMAMR